MRKISARNISKQFLPNSHYVLENISYDFFQGEQYAITGRSGSGKSTLLHIIGLIDLPTKGSILIDDQEIKMPLQNQKKIFNKTIGFLFQTCLFINELSIIENIMLPGIVEGIPNQDCIARAQELLCSVGLIEKKMLHRNHYQEDNNIEQLLQELFFASPLFIG